MELKFKSKNGWHIYGWMIHNLELNSTERDIYAIIFGFSQDEDSMFFGGLKYLEQALKISKPTAINTLKKLVEKDLVLKINDTKNGVTFCYYKTNPNFSGEIDSLSFLQKNPTDSGSDDSENGGGGKKILPVVKSEGSETDSPVVKNFNGGGKEILPRGKKILHTNNNTNYNFNKKERGKNEKFSPPALSEVVEFFKKENIKASAENFWNHWESVGWKKSRGQLIVKWQSLVPKWAENEIQQNNTPHPKVKGAVLSPTKKEQREKLVEDFKKRTRGFVERLQADASALETARIKFNQKCNHPFEFNSQAVYREINSYQIWLTNAPHLIPEEDLHNISLDQFKINFFKWFKTRKHTADLFSETPNKAHRPPQLQNI